MIDLGFDASEDFHTYAFEWRPDSIRWIVDGRQVHEETGQRGPLPSTPGKIFLHAWAGKNLDGWLGRVSYPGRPLVAEAIGRAHVCTPVTNAHLVCRLLLEKKKCIQNTKPFHQ